MPKRALLSLLLTAALLAGPAALAARGDTLTLKDGTVLEGRVVPQGDRYWIKLATGETKIVPKAQVASYAKGNPASPVAPASPAAPAPATPAAPAAPTVVAPAAGDAAKPQAAASGATASDANLNFAQTKSKADRADVPLVAVTFWQTFIDANPASADLPAARAELERWKKLDADKAEKVNGKWIGGEERKKLIARVKELLKEAGEMQATQTLKAVSKLEEAVRLYPNNWEANFELGFFYLSKGGNQKYDQAIRSLETASKLRPNSASTLSNLAIAYNFRSQYEKSVLTAYKAATIEDSKEIVQNLVNSISQAPPGMRENNTKVRPIMEEALLLARKHGVGDGKQAWIYVRPKGRDREGGSSDTEDTSPGVIGNGSGFLVSADGYILTNKHVAAEKNCTFLARFGDGSQKPATVVAIDDEADVALLKIKADKPLPFLQLSDAAEPPVGADCTALGFPIGSVMNYSMQVTGGTVSSVNPAEPYHVTLTCKITHGNSGGPLVDKYGNVIGIVSAGLTAFTETYGKALSPGQVRKFLEKNKSKYQGTFSPASKGTARLDTEEIYKKVSPATVCIILVRTGDKLPGATE
ncbi:MAG TPA: trypsin-like peptidase domain-containing protein [Tepidisphaeraceae bacterium]|nr:trypsin-like peptidase domain-containing protein [Tepidisphaeraceae bacterium]